MGEVYQAKLARLRGLLEREGFGAVVLSRVDNLFWLCDVDTHVGLNSETGIASLVVSAEGVRAVTTNIEQPRLNDEEFGPLGIPVEAVPWYDGGLDPVTARLTDDDGPVASDTPHPQRALVNLAPLRYELLPAEVAAYRALGEDMGEAVGAVAAGFERRESEHRLAGRLSLALRERGITPVVLLVAADERIAWYRHPIPTGKTVENIAMLVACGRRHGLIVAITRIASFQPLSDDLRFRHDAVCQVDAAFISATMPGVSAGTIFAAGQAAYAETGFPEEWKLHHQGGATGYAGRDYKATPSSTEVVRPWQGFAWNPSIAGTKSEDTILAAPGGPEIISASPDWPLLEKEAAGRRFARPDILVR